MDENQKLQQYEAGIDENIKPEDRDAYDRIIAAGLKIITSDQFQNQLMETLDKPEQELPESIADGIARLVSLMHVQSKGRMPMHVVFAASYVLMAKALGFAEKALGKKIDDNILGESALATAGAVAKVYGITPEMLQNATSGGMGEQQSPAQPPAQPQKTGLMGGR